MRDDDRLPEDLEELVDELRATPEVRSEWLASIVERAAREAIDAGRSIPQRRRWSVDPRMAIAAGLLCVAIGAGGTYAALAHGRGATSPSGLTAAATARPTAPVRFAIAAPGAVSVHLVGDFNAWNPTTLPMRQVGDGSTWEVEIGLSPGRYTYAFVVDGRVARDPSAAQVANDDFGVPSSVLLVKGTGT